MSRAHDYDYLIVGSGFGGSVSALRLAEKGYRVAVLESGCRFEDHDFAERLSQLRQMIFAPKLGLKGILRMTPFKHVMILSGSGVGAIKHGERRERVEARVEGAKSGRGGVQKAFQ